MLDMSKRNAVAKLLSDRDVCLLARVRLVSEGQLGATALTVPEWERAEVLTDIVCAFGA